MRTIPAAPADRRTVCRASVGWGAAWVGALSSWCAAQPAVISVAREVTPGQSAVLKLSDADRMDTCDLAADARNVSITLGAIAGGSSSKGTLNLGRAAKCLLVHSFEAGASQQVCAVFSSAAGGYNELVIYGPDGSNSAAMSERGRCSLPGKPLRAVATDLTGDGTAEIIVVTSAGASSRASLGVYAQRGGRIEPITAPLELLNEGDAEPTSIDPADIDDDKDLDLIVRLRGASGGEKRQQVVNQLAPTGTFSLSAGTMSDAP